LWVEVVPVVPGIPGDTQQAVAAVVVEQLLNF
jgi:hypothetical protein